MSVVLYRIEPPKPAAQRIPFGDQTWPWKIHENLPIYLAMIFPAIKLHISLGFTMIYTTEYVRLLLIAN
jgi:hypothetical protein